MADKPKPVIMVCARKGALTHWGPWERAEDFCGECSHVVTYDPELFAEAERRHGRRMVQRICIECAENRLISGEKPDVDLAFTADYIRRRFRH